MASVDGVATFDDIALFKTGTFRLVFSMGALGAGLELASRLVTIGASLASVGCGDTRNPKLETLNPKSETRNPKPETRDPKLAA